MRDTQTGHLFDLDARALEHRRGVEPVNDPDRWPDLEGTRAVPRPAKPFVGKDGRSATPARSVVTEPASGGEEFIPRGDGQRQSSDAAAPGDPNTPTDGGRTRRSKANTSTDAPADTASEGR
ncbi:hypothetical protein ACGFIW_01730 [Micromonospora sp. NPDC048935]|uniref:hypothetical protein n=1 Tax=Micromonospora sp. NPDC048935 TaxID=3364262 RepID=UPI003712D7E4